MAVRAMLLLGMGTKGRGVDDRQLSLMPSEDECFWYVEGALSCQKAPRVSHRAGWT